MGKVNYRHTNKRGALVIGPTDITAIFGQRGSGKSQVGRAIAALYPRLVVIDILQEWKKSDGLDLVTDSFDEAAEFLEKSIGRKSFKMAFQFSVDSRSDEQKQTFNAFLRLMYMRGKLTGENVCLLIEEVQFYCTAGAAEEWLAKLVMVGRHANLAMIMSSQRPAQVFKGIVSQAKNVLVGQLFEHRDIEYLRQTIGDVAEGAATLEKYKFIFHSIGQQPLIVDRSYF